MSSMVKRPRVGQFIAGPTGPESVEVVKEHGRRLIVKDAIGRIEARIRADNGHWTITDGPEYVVTFDTRDVTTPGAMTGLRRMSLADARNLCDFAEPTRHGRIVHVDTREVVPADA